MPTNNTEGEIVRTWMDELVEFYDFCWEVGTQTHAHCANEALIQDFREGGPLFDAMKAAIVEKFPTMNSALKAFKKAHANAQQHTR